VRSPANSSIANRLYSSCVLDRQKDTKVLIFDAFAKGEVALRDIKSELIKLDFKNIRTAVMGASKRLLDVS
jgi:hypothetical protein